MSYPCSITGYMNVAVLPNMFWVFYKTVKDNENYTENVSYKI